jgi:hypothetical protein
MRDGNGMAQQRIQYQDRRGDRHADDEKSGCGFVALQVGAAEAGEVG